MQAGGFTGAHLALHLNISSNTSSNSSSCREGHDWAHVIAADRYNDSTRVVCQGHHIHQFLADTDVSFVCCQCSESTSFVLAKQAFSQQVLDDLFAKRTIEDRIKILSILTTYAKGYLERNSKPINSKNAVFAKFIGGASPPALAAMKVLGFQLNPADEYYYPVDTTIIHPVSLLSQEKVTLLALEELLVTEWNLKKGMGQIEKGIVDVDAGSRLIFGWLGSEGDIGESPQEINSKISVTVVNVSSPPMPHLAEQYARLGCLPNASDEKIKFAFLKQLDDDFGSRSIYLDALIEIANSRTSSFTLPEFIAMERTKRNLHTTSELTTAYGLFSLPPPIAEVGDKYPAHLLTTLFQTRAEEQPALVDELRAGLKILAQDQGHEDAIDLFLETGFAPMGSSSDLMGVAGSPEPTRPIGLENFGNICYLNALIQFYLTIKPLREAVLSVYEDVKTPTTSPQRQVAGSKLPTLPTNNNSKKFLSLLKTLFLKLSEKGGETASVGVERELAVAVLSGSVSLSPPKSSQKMVGVDDEKAMDVDVPEVAVDNKDLLLNAQQDVGEFMDVFVDMAEKGFRSFGDEKKGDMVKRLFFGKTIQTLKYLDNSGAPTTAPTEDEFMYLMIDISHDIYTSLDSYFRTVPVDYENGKALRSVKLKSLPPVLTLQIQRVQYDVSQGQAVKSNQFLKFYDEIDLCGYFAPPENLTPKKYRLHAVLQHEGEAAYGHYKIYIRNHQQRKSWFLYDDSRVSLILESMVESTIFRDTTGSLANAYSLMYVDVDKVDETVQTFVRV
ncbi:UNVERIFIED_CONTAM: ubiquitin-specific protease ubp2 [Siphonaria sp. JEL0065]|nr:ubiquitin-specific protease ubp2 [Siphonaria sp. JEL0065]